jgi:phage shock protein A
MSVMKRLSGIMQAKANKLLDKAEDPRDTLDLSYEQQLENLQKLRRSVAEVATARKRIELQANQLQQQADKLQQQAKQALAQGQQDLAREALTRRAAIGEQLADLQTQHDQVAAQEEKLVATAQRVQAQVEAFRTKKETLKATYTAAQAQTNIGEAISGISESMGDAGLAMQRAQDKIASMQARAGAIDELMASGALSDPTSQPTDDIQAQLDKLSASSEVDAEMARLQAELGGSPAGQLPSAGGVPGAGAAAPVASSIPGQAAPAGAQPAATSAPGAPDDGAPDDGAATDVPLEAEVVEPDQPSTASSADPAAGQP